MTPLAELLIRRIETTGPITLADYMAECLLHPHYGYYSTRDPFGEGGDFITAPEISQMFGELLGLCLAQSWLEQGAPSRFTLAELGPGRGTLMADVMRATARVPGFHAAAQLHLIEASTTLRTRQQATLRQYKATWLSLVQELPDAPLFLLANEFFDALPIRQFRRESQGWSETMVGAKANALCLGRSAPMSLALLEHRLADTRPGDIVEICPAGPTITAAIAARITTNGGLALILDYGDWHSRGNTFQALKAHRFTDPLAEPGAADLTAHVDFEALAAPAACSAYTSQGALLTALGIAQRAALLATRLTGTALAQHQAATRRLTAPDEMGQLFKALAIFAPNTVMPPGFA